MKITIADLVWVHVPKKGDSIFEHYLVFRLELTETHMAWGSRVGDRAEAA
jgi:hypothetical protein